MRILAFLCASALLAADAAEYSAKWFYHANTMGSEADFVRASNLVVRAASCGYNGMVLSANIDSAFAMSNPVREKRLRELRCQCADCGVEIIPMVWSVGYGTMLDIDPDCIEALPVKGVSESVPPPVLIGNKWDVNDSVPGRRRFGIRQKVRPFRHYRFSVRVRTEDMPDGTFMLQVYRKDGESKYLDLRPQLDSNGKWAEAAIEFNPYDQDEVILWCGYWGYRGPGTVEVKDAKLEDLGFRGRPVRGAGLDRADDTDWMGCPPMKDKWGQRCCCMANPKLYEHFRDSARWIQDVLRPKTWFLSMDEIRLAGTCAACARESLPSLLADCLIKQRAAIRAVNPSAEICLWNDMVDVHHNAKDSFYAVNGAFAGALDLLPRDLIIVDWYWEKREQALPEFAARGFRTIAAGYYDDPPAKCRERTESWMESLNRTKGALGTMYTTWGRNYSMLEEFADIVRANANPIAAPVEVRVGIGWRIAPMTSDPVVRHAAQLLSGFFEQNLGLSVPVDATATGDKVIAVGVQPMREERMSRIQILPKSIVLMGVTPREAAQACYRLEDLLTAGDGALETGERTFTRMFSPRMTHSSVALDKFPDDELDRIARAGMDAALVYVGKSPDMTRNGRIDMNDLVRRAETRGLDVYVYAFDAEGATRCDPTAPDAIEQYDRLYGSIVKNAPGVKGMVFVGESVAFPSKLPDMGGYYWNREKGKHAFGFWPSPDWVDWLEVVKKATRKYRSDFDIVFWTYNWFNAPETNRVALLEKVPTDVSVLVTFEMGDGFGRYKGVPIQIDDYSISRPGPSRVFESEAEVLARRGIRFYSMANTGGRTWDFGGAPYEPAPYLWLERFRALRAAQGAYGLAGLMDSHHFGWNPGVVAELAKEAFTRENSDADVDARLFDIAARRFGREAAPKVLAAWRDWTEAMRLHSANAGDQYGPLRVGPSYPFTLTGEDLPPKPKGKWMFLRKDYIIPAWRIPALQELARKELGFWERGIAVMENSLTDVPAGKQDAAKRQIGLGKFCAATVRTLVNFRDFHLGSLEKDVLAMRAAIAAERENVRAAIPVLDADPALGREPTMGVVTDREHLEWKLRQLDQKEREILGQ